MVNIRNAYTTLVGKSKRKRPFGRPRSRCEGITELDIKESECQGVDWIHLARDRVQGAGFCEHGNEPSSCIKGGDQQR
jgi:hypothetical protein